MDDDTEVGDEVGAPEQTGDTDGPDDDRAPRPIETVASGAPTTGRRVLVGAIIVLASLIALVSGVNTWVKRQALDTDAWVDTSTDLLADEDVREALATFVVNELYRNVDLQAELADRLPEDLQGLAGPISASLRGPATDTVEALLATSQVQNLWEELNRTAHSTLVRVIRDDTGPALSTSGGVVVLELGEVVRLLGERLGLSEGLLDRIPEDAGRLTIVESDQLDTVQTVANGIEFASVFLFVLVVGLYALAVVLARPRWREALRTVGWSLVVIGLVVLVARRLGIRAGVEALAEAPDAEAAVRAIFAISTDMLKSIAWSGVAYGLVIVAYTALIGPSGPARAMRRRMAGIMRAEPVRFWGGASVGVLLLVLWGPGGIFDRWITGIVFLALVVAAVESLRRLTVTEFPEGSTTDTPSLLDSLRSRLPSLASPAAGTGGVDLTLESLRRLHDEGELTDEEFAAAKRRALDL